MEATGEHREGERSRGKKKDPNPYGPMRQPVNACVAIPELALFSEFKFSVVGHLAESRRVGARESTGDWASVQRSVQRSYCRMNCITPGSISAPHCSGARW